MKPFDDSKLWIKRFIDDSNSSGCNLEEDCEYLKEMLTAPIARFLPPLSWYLRSKWTDVFKNVKPGNIINALELASGSSVEVPHAIAKLYTDPSSKYTTFNLNKKLTEGFKANVKNLTLPIDVVEDAAQNIYDYYGDDKVDAVIFEHSINDILQGMFAERYGIDTINSDWFDILPEMIKIISSEYKNKTLESSVKAEFMILLDSCYKVLKPGGFICFFHFMYQMDLDLGYNIELYENFVPMVRNWTTDVALGKDASFNGFDPQWWLFIQK